ncbi:MAG: efflux RND transporter periplasmic adaptor subunit [Pseudomonadota bacterium]
MIFEDRIPETVSPCTKLIAGAVLALALAFAIAAWFFGWFGKGSDTAAAPSGPPPANVAIDFAQTMVMSPHTVLPGTVVSVRDAVIASETSGKVLSVAFVGDVISVEDSIAEIDPQNAQQMVEQRRAELQRLESLYQYHSDYYKRVGVEENKLGIPEIGIAELKSNVETAKADVSRAKAALRSAENDLNRTSIKAPFPGRVVSQSIQPGEYAQIGSPVARLVDTVNLEISARVPAALVQPIEPGTLLSIEGNGLSFQAPVRALVPVGDSISRTMELRVTLKDSGLLVGSPVRVSLPSAAPKEVVAIPRDAVILRTDSQYVFVIEEGKAQRRNVELGYAEGDMIEVIGDVDANASVVVRGGERLRDGQQVSYEESGASSAVGLTSAP